MIKVNVLVNKNIEQITLVGHADFDDFGKDIVCSAASSIVTTTVNAIIRFDKDYISYKEENDKFIITINTWNEVVNNLITNMLVLLKELEKDYPSNIKIKEEMR